MKDEDTFIKQTAIDMDSKDELTLFTPEQLYKLFKG